MEQKFFICEHCGNIIELIRDKGHQIHCCGQKMTRLIPATTEGAAEKHIPKYKIEDNRVVVVVGDVMHPMSEEHHIEWISLQTKTEVQRKYLSPTEEPRIAFPICTGDEVIAVYAYCNLHGLWKSE